ncbi:uncharacterized protein EV420DRAFT_816960 [Desarmillaria tabescens]|uniref:Mid2 domain-containing protein n=1 Tax=Armillaria tabescens TaxID=1929756 RepID=A0AA39TTT3_ARMTA|nr:uncharacterized protein EV420DRAFT_816960 [Desarmillaria tabescens]KAK0466228.1 hypothetical protein EV420DRAFT_816960 [Desarmillaria tabescens]
MCDPSTTEEGRPKGIVDLSFSASPFGQGHPKTRSPKCHSSLPSSLSLTSARPSFEHHDTDTSSARSIRSPSPSSPIFPTPFALPPPHRTSATSISSSSRNTPLSAPSPLSPTNVIFRTITVTEPPVTRTKTLVITATLPPITATITETARLTTTLPPTTQTEIILIQSTETKTTTITQTETATPPTKSTSPQKDSVSKILVAGGISGIVLVILDLIILLVLLCRYLFRRRKNRGASDVSNIPPSPVSRLSRSHDSPSSSTFMASVRSRDDPYPRTIRHDGTRSRVSMIPNGDLPLGPSEAEYRPSNNTFAGPLDMEWTYGLRRQGMDSREASTPRSRFSDPTVSSGQLSTTRKKSLWSVFRIRGFDRRKSTASNC